MTLKSWERYQVKTSFLDCGISLCVCQIPHPEEGSPSAQAEAYDLAVRLIKQFDNIEESQRLKEEEKASRHKGSVLVFLPGQFSEFSQAVYQF